MRNWNELTATEQTEVSRRFILPFERSELQVNEHLVPFERISGALMSCTVRNTNFHIHENKNR